MVPPRRAVLGVRIMQPAVFSGSQMPAADPSPRTVPTAVYNYRMSPTEKENKVAFPFISLISIFSALSRIHLGPCS